MKAVALTGPGTLELTDDWPEPQRTPDEVLVQLEGMGVCGSDLAVFDGSRSTPRTPWVVGHEGFGRVVAAADVPGGPGAGRRVVVEPNYACLHCADCSRGLTSACPQRTIVGMNAPGLLAERVAVPAPFAHPVPDSADAADLACAEPYTVARTAVRRSGITAGEWALVVGAGAQGLLVSQALLALGARPTVVEPHPLRAERARRLGAGVVTGTDCGFGHVFETSGVGDALAAALDRAAAGATVTAVGLSPQQLPLSMERLVRGQFTLRGSLIYDHPHDFTAALDDIAQRRVRPAAALEEGFPWEQAQQAFAGARERAGKTWIRVPDTANGTAEGTATATCPATTAPAGTYPGTGTDRDDDATTHRTHRTHA